MIWHGSHQVAQKSTITTLPFRLSRSTVWPSRSLSTSFGAGAPILIGEGPSAFDCVVPSAAFLRAAVLSASCLIQTEASAAVASRMPIVSSLELADVGGAGVGCGSGWTSGFGLRGDSSMQLLFYRDILKA